MLRYFGFLAVFSWGVGSGFRVLIVQFHRVLWGRNEGLVSLFWVGLHGWLLI